MKPVFSRANFFCAFVLAFYLATGTGHAAGAVVSWGYNNFSQTNVPAGVTNAVAVAGGTDQSLALRSNGAVVGWGNNASGQTSAPSNLTNAVAIAAGNGFSLALKSNGTVVAWGSQSTVPAIATNVVAISASLSNAMALTESGNVVSWISGPTPPANATNIVAIAAGNTHSLALRGDGAVIAWGNNTWGQTNVPAGLTNVVALAAGQYHSLALKSDGTVAAWGDNTWNQTNIPAGLSNVVAISAESLDNLVLLQNGTVVMWGDNTFFQTNRPAGLTNVVGIAAGSFHGLAVVGNGSPVITVQPVSQYNTGTRNASFTVMAAGLAPLSYQWQQNGTNIAGATNSVLVLTNILTSQAGVFSVTVSNSLGTVTSANVELPPVWRQPFFLAQPQSQNIACGNNVTFQTVADGTKPLSYQWQFAGTNIVNATNAVLTLNSITGANAGPYTIVVTNGNGSATSQAAVLSVFGQPPLITSALTASGKQGSSFSYTITGILNPTSFSASGLPNGLNVNTTNGVISGTPLVSGAFIVTLGTMNLCASASTNLTLNISSSVPVITSATTATGQEESAFNYTIRATQTPTSFGAANLPQGLTVNPASGVISGSPLYAGIYTATISATNVWGVGTASLQLTISNAAISGLSIANVITNYSTPYLVQFQFSLRDNNNPALGDAIVANPQLFTVTAYENGQPVNTTNTSVLIQSVDSNNGDITVLKANLVLDFSQSIASLSNGDTNNNGISDAVETELAAAQTFVNQQTADAQIGVYEFHRDDEAPQQVQPLTTDKTLLDNSIAGILTNYVQNFSSGSRCWDALVAAIKNLGPTNSDEAHYVIFCSDGNDTSSTNTVQSVINVASNANVQVYCVGFGNQLNTNTLYSITSQTQGRYYTATNVSDLAVQFAEIGKDLSGQYILRWATLQRSTNAFMPSFQITYQGITATSPPNPPPVITGTNIVYATNMSGTITTNTTFTYTTNYIISPFFPTAYAGDVTVGSLRLVSDPVVNTSAITMRTTYVPRYIRQINVHYQPNWPCAVSLESTNPGEMLYGWSLTQTNDGAGGFWAMLTSSNQLNLASSIPFASFGPLLTFTFRDVIDTNGDAFNFLYVDNTIYTNGYPLNTNAEYQSFTNQNFASFTTAYPVLPYGTPVPWLIGYGFTDPTAWVADETNLDNLGTPIWQDYVDGLNPTNDTGFAVLNVSPAPTPGQYQITFSTVLNRTYRVEWSGNLYNWQTLQANIAGTGGNVTVTDARNQTNATPVFYRVTVNAYTGNTVGILLLNANTNTNPTSITLGVTNVPYNITQIRLHYMANWPSTISLQSTNPGGIFYGWSLTQTNDGAGGQWALISSPNPQDLASSIPFNASAPLLTFTFRDVLPATTNAFSVLNVDNTLYTNTGGQTLLLANTNAFITVYAALPHGTPVPWLIEYGFTNNFAASETNVVNGSGLQVWQDYVAGLNPTNGAAVFNVKNFSPAGQPAQYQITFPTVLNRTYTVQASGNLKTWQTVQGGIAGTGGNVTVTDTRTVTGTAQFYRVVVSVF
jgi:hypothetical protein